tara:strand:+ start:68 stop:364 length:297 start_codon:yes stop_codon:yes gene_type:complete
MYNKKKGDKMKNTKLKKDIMKIAEAESATEIGLCCGTLFVKFNSSNYQKLSNNLKTKLQTFFDNRKKNDCYVKMSQVGSTEYAYDFIPIVDYRLEGII